MTAKRRVVILGGGVTGLAAADAITRSGAGAFDVTVIEGRARLGGNVATEPYEGFTIDPGPDSWVSAKPHATALAKSLGLESRLIGTKPENRRVYIAWGKELHPMPEGMVLGIPTEVMPIARSSLFSWDAKLRMALEPMIPARRWEDGDDESIGDFLARRLGDEVADRLAGPLLSGIFAGDAREISVRAAFPQLVDAEAKHGSLVKAMRALRAQRKTNAGGEGSAFTSLLGGVGELIEALGKRVEGAATIERGTGAHSVERDGRGYRVVLEDGRALPADDVIFALPLPVSARLSASLDRDLSGALAEFRVATTAVAFLAYKREAIAHKLDATGFLIPRSLGKSILAATFVSSKWDHRAPPGHALVRVFFGGATNAQIVEREDADMVKLARTDLAAYVTIAGEPLFSRVFRFVGASPQPIVGHMGRVRAVQKRLTELPGVYVAGNGFEGSGIPDCVKQAEGVARAVVGRAG